MRMLGLIDHFTVNTRSVNEITLLQISHPVITKRTTCSGHDGVPKHF